MPYNFRKLPNQNLYRVYNSKTKEIHSYGTTLENAKKQIKLLNMVDAGVPLKKGKGSYISKNKVNPISLNPDEIIVSNPAPINNQIIPEVVNQPNTLVIQQLTFRLDEKINEKNILLDEIDILKTRLLDLDIEDRKSKEFSRLKLQIRLKENKVVKINEKLDELNNKYIEITGIPYLAPVDVDEIEIGGLGIKNSKFKQSKNLGKNPILLEMFKGTGSVGKQAKKMGFQVTSLDFDPIYTPDIETDILDWDYKKYSNENNYIPDMIWSSPPCNTYSPMVYRLKERDVETAKPLSDRAKLGTKILYKTLEIIEYFLKKNPKLLFIIENPRGMMRKDKEMKKLARETTLYCLYGDFKRKPTDFWNNFPNGLGIDQETKECPGKVIPVQNLKTIEERYSMPAKLIKHFLEEFKQQYSVKSGGSIETDKFDENGIVSLPEFRSVKINLPTYMYKIQPYIGRKPPPYRYKLVIPITSSRNISSRKKETSLIINQKPISNPTFDIEDTALVEPRLHQFSPEDRRKIQTYYNKVKENERLNPNEVDKDDYEIIPRGRPLPCDGPKKSKNLGKEGKKLGKESKKLGKEDSFLDNLQKELNDEPKQRGRPKNPKKVEEPKEDLFAKLMEEPYEKVNPSEEKAGFTKEQIISRIEKLEKEQDNLDNKSIRTQDEIVRENPKKYKNINKNDIFWRINIPNKLTNEENKRLIELRNEIEDLNKQLVRIEGKGLLSKNKILSNNNRMANPWIEYVKSYASKNGMSYRDALRCPKCKAGYKKGGKVGMGVVDEIGNQDLLAEMYNDSELGANAGKKYISL